MSCGECQREAGQEVELSPDWIKLGRQLQKFEDVSDAAEVIAAMMALKYDPTKDPARLLKRLYFDVARVLSTTASKNAGRRESGLREHQPGGKQHDQSTHSKDKQASGNTGRNRASSPAIGSGGRLVNKNGKLVRERPGTALPGQKPFKSRYKPGAQIERRYQNSVKASRLRQYGKALGVAGFGGLLATSFIARGFPITGLFLGGFTLGRGLRIANRALRHRKRKQRLRAELIRRGVPGY